METHGNKTTSTEKIIYYRKGDESYPRTEDLSKEDWSEYFFSDIYEKAVGLIQDIVQINLLNKRNKDRYNYANNVESTNSLNIRFDISVNNVIQNSYDTRNNIIAFVGERGSGKTSCLQTVYNNIPKIERLRNLQCKFNNHMPIIDPSYFNEHSNILEIVIAQMFQIFKDALQHPEKYFLHDDNLLEKKRNLVKSFQEVKETLDCIDTPIKSSDTNDSVEALSRMAASNNLKQQMEKLIDGYLSYFNGQSESVLVIAIDDLDVQTKHTYTMLEQISKYLIVDRVVILIGVKLKQLSDLVKQNYYTDFQQLMLKNNVTNNQIDDMASRYLLKLIPISHRLMLPSMYDVSTIKLDINDDADADYLSQTILKLIYERTRITFYNSLEQESLIIPHNFREILNLLSFILKLPVINQDDKEELRRDAIIRNRNSFKYYFINSWCLDKLSSEQYLFIKELIDCDIIQVNKFIVHRMNEWYKEFFERSTIIDCEIFNGHNRSYNISIADVQSVLDTLSTKNDMQTIRLIFAIKTIYSMLLYEKFHEMNHPSILKRSCQELVNRSKHTIKRNWRSNNKLNYLSDYEILLGGNILNIFMCKENGNILYDKRLYIGAINGKALIKIYDEIWMKYSSHIHSKDKINISESDQIKFNVFEFFLLSILVENPLPNYRTFKHCYYDTFPINELSEQTVIFSIPAILYNAIHFYKLYQIFFNMRPYYSYIGNEYGDENEIESINKFFSLVDYFCDKSIIYKLLHICINENQMLSDSTIFKNQFLEDYFLINIEEIDVMENYLGHINKYREVNDKKVEYIQQMKEYEEEYKVAKNEKQTFKNEERYLVYKISEYSKMFEKNDADDLKNVDPKSYKEYQTLKNHLKYIRDEIIDLERKQKTIALRMSIERNNILKLNKEDKTINMQKIKSFIKKFRDFQYVIDEGGYNSRARLKANEQYVKKFDFLQPIVDAFNKTEFEDEFYKIYSSIV